MIQPMPCNVSEALRFSAERTPTAPAVKTPTHVWTFAELRDASRRAGRRVAAATANPRVGLLGPMSAEFIALFFGIQAAGKTAAPLNFLLPPEELAFVLRDSALDLIVSFGPLLDLAGRLPVRVEDGGRWLDEDLAAAAEESQGVETSADARDTALLLYTSGTSGRPKGVMLTHENLMANALASAQAAGMTADLCALNCLPSFHTFPLTAALIAPLAVGASVVPAAKFEPDAVLGFIERMGVNMLLMVPSMYRLLIRAAERVEKPPCLRLAISGGEPLATATAERFERVFGVPLLEGYGQTETSPVISLNRPGRWKSGSAGVPLENLEVTIAEPATGRPLPSGVEGEVVVRGPSVMKGYLNLPEETAKVLGNDGRLRTGDLGRIDEDGFLFLTGRLSEMIKVGGEKVYPAEVEAVLLKHPDVLEVGVRGAPDERRGETVEAFVVLKPEAQDTSADALAEFCRRNLAAYQAPRRIHLRPSLPKGPTGKVLRRALK
jgi:long-chain acyl-CoA synthetase